MNNSTNPAPNLKPVLDTRAVFDRVSASIILMLILPWMLWRTLFAFVRHGRIFDRIEYILSNGSTLTLNKFAGLEYGRDLALLIHVVSGKLAWVGNFSDKNKAAAVQKLNQVQRVNYRPGLINPSKTREQIGIQYIDSNSKKNEHADYTLLESIKIIGQYLFSSLLAPSRTSRNPDHFKFLGVTVHNHTIESALAKFREKNDSGKATRLAFINPDCLNKAAKDSEYCSALESMDAVFADGSGLQLASRMLGFNLKANINGTDLFPLLCEQCANNNHSIFLLGARDGIAQATADNMVAKFPNLKIAGIQHGYFKRDETARVISDINTSKADIVLVAFGAPHQELWINEFHDQIETRVMVGVGGLFDFFSGRISRSPRWLQDLGMEWIWRLLQEPSRMWKRYIIGNPAFLYRVWRQTRQESGKRVIKRFSNLQTGSLRNTLSYLSTRIVYNLVQLISRSLRRGMDIVVSTVALMMLSPILILVCVLVKLESSGPIFFTQQRVGKWGVLFSMYKFRSMCQDAEILKEGLIDANEMESGVLFKMQSDPRITRVGHIIRKYSIDELPQLWNVLRGDMALVGPRPPVPSEVAQYTIEDRRRLEIKPGITCIWQVSGRSDIPFPQQVELDVDYIDTHGILTDIRILLKTIPAVLRGKGAY